ncbi:MAG TPA: alpha/beta hydrolase [Rhizomicrobium sp.]|jgi:lysophospholipase|nr:alpha/beta hydrolase [Rhizomicrobium sp.]
MIPAATLFEPLPIKAVGASLRAARFPAAPDVAARGVCVLLNGQTEFIEKYFEVIDELRERGFSVATMDWRGQGGSTRMTEDSRKSFVGDFSEYDDDLDTLLNWIVTPMLGASEKPVALAHSMGAHVLLRRLVHKPGGFRACVLTAPMIAISFRGQREFLVRAVTRYHLWRGQHAGWVWGMESRDPYKVSFAGQLVTSDPQRFERTQSLLRERPELRLAGATWGWLAAALRSMDWLKDKAPSIATPLLLVGAGKDRICVTPQTRAFAARLPRADYVEIKQAEHEILMERSPLRTEFWSAFDGFMAREKHRVPD